MKESTLSPHTGLMATTFLPIWVQYLEGAGAFSSGVIVYNDFANVTVNLKNKPESLNITTYVMAMINNTWQYITHDQLHIKLKYEE